MCRCVILLERLGAFWARLAGKYSGWPLNVSWSLGGLGSLWGSWELLSVSSSNVSGMPGKRRVLLLLQQLFCMSVEHLMKCGGSGVLPGLQPQFLVMTVERLRNMGWLESSGTVVKYHLCMLKSGPLPS